MRHSFCANGLSVGYNGTALLADINLQLEQSKIYAILGLNGTGKTTFLKTILGIIPPIAGSCEVFGKQLFKLSHSERARLVSYVPQRFGDSRFVSVLDVVMMGLNAQLAPLQPYNSSHRKAALQQLSDFGLASFAEIDFQTLSAGQQQMVILCRALVSSTPLLVMDEPDSSLDFPHKHDILAKVGALAHETEKTVLITLHDPNFALAYCDALLLLSENRFSQLDLHTASKEQIETALQSLYGNVSLIKHKTLSSW